MVIRGVSLMQQEESMVLELSTGKGIKAAIAVPNVTIQVFDSLLSSVTVMLLFSLIHFTCWSANARKNCCGHDTTAAPPA
jgi:hypothetical protein